MLFATYYAGVLLAASQVVSAASWGFKDGSIAVSVKGAGVGGATKETLVAKSPLKKAIELGPSDSIKILLTTQEGKTAKRAHQTYLSISDSAGLQTSFPLQVKDNGKGKLELTHKEIPAQLLASSSPLTASLIIASFGDSTPFEEKAFNLVIKHDANTPFTAPAQPVRYGKLEEIHHIFRADAKNPPRIISAFFTLVVLAALPVLLGSWVLLGANASHISKALGAAPFAHTLYFGGIVAMEGVFFLYYTTWNLFQVLPVATAVGIVIFLSGSKALTEVQERRLAGLR